MGMEARIVLHAPDRDAAERAAALAFARIAELDRALSDYRKDSELVRLDATAGGAAVPVSDDLFRVLGRALDLARETDGAFDPTAGPFVRLWREARRAGRTPEPAALRNAAAHVGWRHVRLDTAARTVRLALPDMALDLGGIAKGYAVDEALAVLRSRGVHRALVELGGEIAAGLPPPGQEGWRVEVADAEPEGRWVLLREAAISSSGDAAQFVEADGVRHSHVLDPRTGLALTHRATATVVAPDAFTADALATAVTVLDAERRRAFVASHPEATFYVRAVGVRLRSGDPTGPSGPLPPYRSPSRCEYLRAKAG